MATSEEAMKAQSDLMQAIHNFVDTLRGDTSFVEGWVLVLDIESMEPGNPGTVSMVSNGGWIRTRALLDIALTKDRATQSAAIYKGMSD